MGAVVPLPAIQAWIFWVPGVDCRLARKLYMEFLYDTIYRLCTKVPTNNNPALSATLILAMIQCANAATVLTLINRVFLGVQFSSRQNLNLAAALSSLLIIGINFRWL